MSENDYINQQLDSLEKSLDPILRKIVKAIFTNEAARKVYRQYAVLFCNEGKTIAIEELCYYRLDCAAGNHCFDDEPEMFGIEKNEGHALRAAFQEAGTNYPKEALDAKIKPIVEAEFQSLDRSSSSNGTTTES